MNFYTINRGVSKRLYNYFSYQSRKVSYTKKIKRLVKLKNCKRLTKGQKDEIKKYYAAFGLKGINTNWHRYYTHMSGQFHKEYIPEDIFFNIIEPSLNIVKMSSGLTDKNLLNKIIRGVDQAKTIIRNINGFYFFEDKDEILDVNKVLSICKTHPKLVIKPSIGSYGGNNVVVFSLNNNKTDYKGLTLEALMKSYDKNFIIQEWIDQHEKISSLNPSSVNTIRSKTLLVDNEVVFLTNLLRIGAMNSQVDNSSQGGLTCVINNDGSLYSQGYDSNNNLIAESHTNVKFQGFKIPNFEKVKKIIKELHLQIPYFKMVSWDIAINKNEEPVLVEFNVISQGAFSQHSYGPLFGDYTEQVLTGIEHNKFKTEVRHILIGVPFN